VWYGEKIEEISISVALSLLLYYITIRSGCRFFSFSEHVLVRMPTLVRSLQLRYIRSSLRHVHGKNCVHIPVHQNILYVYKFLLLTDEIKKKKKSYWINSSSG
jgi:hypothetical protein